MKKELAALLSYTYQDGECLVWTRCFNTDGYPRASVDGNSNAKVHRVVYELVNGPLEKGQVVRHTCDNPKCINPAHLLAGTHTDNMRDRDERERHGKSKVTKEQVRMIRDLWDTNNYLQKELADTLPPSLIQSYFPHLELPSIS